MRVLAMVFCSFILFPLPVLAEKVPTLPETAVFVTKISTKRDWAGDAPLDSYLYSDTFGGVPVFWEVYYFKKHRYPIRITYREVYGEEVTAWKAAGFEE